jgi:hypothetical protein
LTIAEKDLADLAFSGLRTHIKDKLEGQEFLDVDQVLQKALAQENRDKKIKQCSRFNDNKNKEENHIVSYLDNGSGSASEEDIDLCVAEWVKVPKSNPIACSAPKPTPAKREEIKYTFDVSKCDEIFDVLLQRKLIRVREGHIILPPGELGKVAYCKLHDSFSHSTNDCDVFQRQVQSALNDGRLTFTHSIKMKLDSGSFPIDVIDFENKKVLVRSDQTESTQGKNVVVDHSAAPRMVKPKNPEVRVWKVNGGRKQAQKIKPTVIMLLEKYTSPKANNVSNRLGGVKRSKSPCGPGGHERWRKTSYDQQPCYPMEPAYWGCAPPMCPQFSPWGFNPWALYTSGPAAYFQPESVPAGPI